MSHAPPTISRRCFITACGQLTVLFALSRPNQPLRAAPAQAAPQANGYGVGAYGQAIYVGTVNQIYLPLVNKGA